MAIVASQTEGKKSKSVSSPKRPSWVSLLRAVPGALRIPNKQCPAETSVVDGTVVRRTALKNKLGKHDVHQAAYVCWEMMG